jgi:hypothetical protein
MYSNDASDAVDLASIQVVRYAEFLKPSLEGGILYSVLFFGFVVVFYEVRRVMVIFRNRCPVRTSSGFFRSWYNSRN